MAGPAILAHTQISSTHILLLFESLAILKKSFSFRSNAAGSHSNSQFWLGILLSVCAVCVSLDMARWNRPWRAAVAVKMETKQFSLSVPCASLLTSHIYTLGSQMDKRNGVKGQVATPQTETKMNKQKKDRLNLEGEEDKIENEFQHLCRYSLLERLSLSVTH